MKDPLCPGLAGEALTEALGDIRGDGRGVILSNASCRVNRILGRSKLSAEKFIKIFVKILGQHKKGDFNVGSIDYPMNIIQTHKPLKTKPQKFLQTLQFCPKKGPNVCN